LSSSTIDPYTMQCPSVRLMTAGITYSANDLTTTMKLNDMVPGKEDNIY